MKMYAVIELKGKQIRVEAGDKIVVNRINEQKSMLNPPDGYC